MSGQFSFNFSGDDIEAGQDGALDAMGPKNDSHRVDEAEAEAVPQAPPRVHSLEEMVGMRFGVFHLVQFCCSKSDDE